MEGKKKIERKKFEESKKPGYVLSHLYEDISSEEKPCRPVNTLGLSIENEDLNEISVRTEDFDFVDQILGDGDSVTSVSEDREVILEELTPCIIDSEDTRDYVRL